MVDKIMHFHLKDACLDEDNPMCITTRLCANVVDMTDDTIVDACVKAAREAGINDAWLLDKKFVLDAIRDKIQEKEQDFPRWISVEERLPEYDRWVLCWYTDRNGINWHTVGMINSRNKKWALDICHDDCVYDSTVTHWMPLPEPPKEVQK